MVLVGGATRLTESGLSITQWKPVTGVIPPMSGAEWQAEFDRYKQIPQFAKLNPDMTLDGFKTIFWWEWGHRLLARVVGAAFIIPGLWFWRQGQLKGALGRQVAVATGLLALEPIVGWWMVTSGLSERTEVAQQRLALHLMIAAATFGALIYAAAGLGERPRPGAVAAGLRDFRRACSPRWSSASSASAPWSPACAPASSTIPGRSWDRASFPAKRSSRAGCKRCSTTRRRRSSIIGCSPTSIVAFAVLQAIAAFRAAPGAPVASRAARPRRSGDASGRARRRDAPLPCPHRTGACASGAGARPLRPRHRPPSRDRDRASRSISRPQLRQPDYHARCPETGEKCYKRACRGLRRRCGDADGSGAPAADRGKLRCRM